MAEVVAVSISENKGEQKENVESAMLQEEHGLVGDAHAGKWHRQVSLLAEKSIQKMQVQGAEVTAGDFAENITTAGIDLLDLPVGSRFKIGDEAILEVTQHGKECHHDCEVYKQVGDCVMPREGIFAKVIQGGEIEPGAQIEVLAND